MTYDNHRGQSSPPGTSAHDKAVEIIFTAYSE